MTTTTRTTRSRTTTETLTTTATGTTTRTRTTTTTRTTTRTRRAPAAASEPEVPPSPPAAPAQEASKPTAPRSPRADKDPKDQDVPPAPAEKTEVFEGVRIRVGSVHPRGGYVHWRSRRQVLAEGLDIGILPEVLHEKELLTERQKPSEVGFKRTEKLIVQVKRARERGEDPAPLWARWLPPVARKQRKAA